MHADRIYVLQKGRIIESGPHAALIKNRDGLYAALWKEQSGAEGEELAPGLLT